MVRLRADRSRRGAGLAAMVVMTWAWLLAPGCDGGDHGDHVVGNGFPQIDFESTTQDLGVITDTQTHRVSFPFTNSGSGTLVISNITASCGCTTPSLDRTEFASGEGSTIDVVFDPRSKSESVTNTITVVSNVPGQEVVKLYLKSEVRPLIRVERLMRMGNLPLGQETRRVLRLNYDDPDMQLTPPQTNNRHVAVKLLETGRPQAGGAHQAEIEVTVLPTAPWGALFATWVKFGATGRPALDADRASAEYTTYVIGNVFGNLRVDDSVVSIGILKPGAGFRGSTLLRHRGGEPFEITNVRVARSDIPDLRANVVSISPSEWEVSVSGATGGYLGSIKGELEIETDVPGEEQLVLRFSGLVKQAG